MRIGFLFNHHAGHQLLHAAPIAFELSRRFPQHETRILVSSLQLARLAARIGARYTGHRAIVEVLAAPLLARGLEPLARPFAFIGKRLLLGAHAGRFRELDVLVVPEKTSLALRRQPGLEHLRIVYTHHGAGDRAEAFYPELAEFDLVLAAGEKIAARLLASGLVQPERLAVVGYPKFSVIGSLGAGSHVFAEQRPTVLYNPHYSRSESSWARWGSRVLDYFRDSSRYNLIFAPHVLLYQRWLRHRARPLGRWRGRCNIHLDTGSDASLDMSHALSADIYLGDVSSQVYEFLWRPRQVVFLDVRGIGNWQQDPSFEMWHAGEVVQDPQRLGAALDRAAERHAAYRAAQQELFARTFDTTAVPAETRAAEAIVGAFG